VMKPTPLCNAQGYYYRLPSYTRGGRPSFKRQFSSPIRPSPVRVHTPISWHRVDCCYCCCYHFNSTVLPSRQEKKRENIICICIFPPFSLTTRRLVTVAAHVTSQITFFNWPFDFRLSFTFFSKKGLGTNRNGTLNEKALKLLYTHKTARQFMGI
jgi:hypothetical protein